MLVMVEQNLASGNLLMSGKGNILVISDIATVQLQGHTQLISRNMFVYVCVC
jgi:hypothetical protein